LGDQLSTDAAGPRLAGFAADRYGSLFDGLAAELFQRGADLISRRSHATEAGVR
jgi:hypothetical protein